MTTKNEKFKNNRDNFLRQGYTEIEVDGKQGLLSPDGMEMVFFNDTELQAKNDLIEIEEVLYGHDIRIKEIEQSPIYETKRSNDEVLGEVK